MRMDHRLVSLRVRSDLLANGGMQQEVEVLDAEGKVLGLLNGVTRAVTITRPDHIDKLVLTLDCRATVETYGEFRRGVAEP